MTHRLAHLHGITVDNLAGPARKWCGVVGVNGRVVAKLQFLTDSSTWVGTLSIEIRGARLRPDALQARAAYHLNGIAPTQDVVARDDGTIMVRNVDKRVLELLGFDTSDTVVEGHEHMEQQFKLPPSLAVATDPQGGDVFAIAGPRFRNTTLSSSGVGDYMVYLDPIGYPDPSPPPNTWTPVVEWYCSAR